MVIIGPALSKIVRSWDEADDSVHELGWLFDMEEKNDEEIPKKQPVVCRTKECEIIGQ